jgi:hypothetical protein
LGGTGEQALISVEASPMPPCQPSCSAEADDGSCADKTDAQKAKPLEATDRVALQFEAIMSLKISHLKTRGAESHYVIEMNTLKGLA